MRYIGPIVRNDLFFFVTMLALAGLMMLLEYKRRTPITLATATPADKRRAEWTQRREKMWMTAVVVTSFVFIFLSTAEFIYAKSTTALSPDHRGHPHRQPGHRPHLADHRRQAPPLRRPVEDAKGGSVEVRFLLYKKPDGNIVSVADACHICGPVGFYISSQGITCKMCASPLGPLDGPARTAATPSRCSPPTAAARSSSSRRPPRPGPGLRANDSSPSLESYPFPPTRIRSRDNCHHAPKRDPISLQVHRSWMARYSASDPRRP